MGNRCTWELYGKHFYPKCIGFLRLETDNCYYTYSFCPFCGGRLELIDKETKKIIEILEESEDEE